MATYSVPGVYVSESPLVQNVNRSNTTQSIAAFIGTAPRGPETPTLINSWSAFKNYYDDAETGYELPYSVYHYFANGGRDAYIIRATNASAAAASVVMPYYPNGSGAASGSLFTGTANSRGTWGNSLSLRTTSGGTAATATQIPTFNLSILLNGVEVERWNEVSTDPSNNRYLEAVLNNFSKFITVTVPSGAKTAASTWVPYTTAAVPLAGGASGGAAVDYQAAADKLEALEGVLLINAPGVTDTATVNLLIGKAESRGNSFVVIDPTTAAPSDYGSTVANLYTSSSYAAVYYPMLKMADPAKSGPAAIRDTYPGGAVMGAFVRTEVARTVAKAPAGFTTDVRNAFGLYGTKPTAAQAGTLYDTYGVNVFKAVPGGGIIINGARTLDKTSPGKYIPIRRSLNYVKQGLKDLTSYAVFEPNDDRLWASVSIRSSSFLNQFWRAGGLKGRNAAEAFYIICDETNNTDETIAQGEVRLEVGVALQYPAEYIVISVSQWTGGSNAASTL
jgi:hypothetical protein